MDEDILFIIGVILIVIFIIIITIKGVHYLIIKLLESKIGQEVRELVVVNMNKVVKNSQKSISRFYLTGCTWILVNEKSNSILYTFRTNGELLITINGIVEKHQYELIVDNNTILITKNGIIEHYNIFNDRDHFLFLNKLSVNQILLFANQTKYKDELKSTLRRIAEDAYYKKH